MTNKEISSTTTAAKSEKNSETTLDTQEVLKETSSSKGALPSINFDVPTENIPQRQLTEEEALKAYKGLLDSIEQIQKSIEGITLNLPSPADIIHELMVTIQPILNSFKDFELYVEKLKPFIEKELKKEQQQHPEIKDITVDDIATTSVCSLLNVDETELEQLKKEFADSLDPISQNIELVYNMINNAKDAYEKTQKIGLLPKQKRANAEAQGAIITIAERLFVPTDPDYQDAFITKIGNCSIGLFKRDAKSGKKQLALDINTPFLSALAKAILITFINGNQGETSIYFPTFAKELGYDLNEKMKNGETNNPSRAESRENFINALIVKLDNIWGVLPNDTTEYKLISVHAYNPDTEILYFTSPYIQKLISAQLRKEAARLESGNPYYLGNCDLLHSTAANERNHAAVEMATRILVGLQQRGLTPDAELPQNKKKSFTDKTIISFSITCKGLIQDCPKIRERLKTQPTASQKTQTLKRTFTAMYKILKNKTDLFLYYTNASITETIPTSRTLDTKIIITHHGGNPTYRRNILPLIDQ